MKSFGIQEICDKMTILIGNRVGGSGTEEGGRVRYKKERKECEYQFHFPHLCLLLPTSTSSSRCHGSDYAECHKLQTLSLLFCVGEVENQNKKSTFL